MEGAGVDASGLAEPVIVVASVGSLVVSLGFSSSPCAVLAPMPPLDVGDAVSAGEDMEKEERKAGSCPPRNLPCVLDELLSAAFPARVHAPTAHESLPRVDRALF